MVGHHAGEFGDKEETKQDVNACHTIDLARVYNFFFWFEYEPPNFSHDPQATQLIDNDFFLKVASIILIPGARNSMAS